MRELDRIKCDRIELKHQVFELQTMVERKQKELDRVQRERDTVHIAPQVQIAKTLALPEISGIQSQVSESSPFFEASAVISLDIERHLASGHHRLGA